MIGLLRREILGLLRARWTFWLLLSTTASTALLPLVYWPQSEADAVRRTGDAFSVFFIAQLLAVLLIVPAASAGAIAGERERGTFELLFSTPLSGAEVLVAKAAAPLMLVLLGLAATLPAAAALQLHGGVRFRSVLACYMVVAATAVMAAAGSLGQSARSSTSVGAVTRALVWSAVWSSGPFIGLGVVAFGVFGAVSELLRFEAQHPGSPGAVRRLFDAGMRWVAIVAITAGGLLFAFPITIFLMLPMGWALCLTPFVAVLNELKNGIKIGAPNPIAFVSFAVVVGAFQARKLVRSLAQAQVTGDEPRLDLGVETPAGAAGALSRSWLTRLVLDWGARDVRLCSNPVFLQELRTQFHGNVLYRLGLFWVTGIGCTLSWLATGIPQATFVTAALLGLAFLPAAGAVGFAREVEGGNLDFLRASRLSPAEILRGKLLAALMTVAAPVIAGFGAGGIALGAAYRSRTSWQGLGESAVDLVLRAAVLTSGLAAVVTLAMACSTLARRSLHAILLAYGAAFALHVGTALVAFFSSSGWAPGALSGVSPIALLIGTAAGTRGPSGLAARTAVELLLGAALHAALAALFYCFAHRRVVRVCARGV